MLKQIDAYKKKKKKTDYVDKNASDTNLHTNLNDILSNNPRYFVHYNMLIKPADLHNLNILLSHF